MSLRAGLVRSVLSTTGRVAPALAARAALPLFTRPGFRVPQRPREEEVMRRATREEVPVRDVTAVVYRWGDGRRPVLVMHGWQSRASRFHALIGALADAGYSPVAFDAPGHGASGGHGTTILDYREIAGRLQQRHGRFAAVVGHSVGGLAAFVLTRETIAADRLVSVGAPAGFGYILNGFCAGLGLGDDVKPHLRRAIEQRLFPGEGDIWERFSATHRPRDLALPMLVVHDRDDDLIGADQAHRIARAHEGKADLLITEGLGHRRVLADPAVVAAVLDFASATDPVG